MKVSSTLWAIMLLWISSTCLALAQDSPTVIWAGNLVDVVEGKLKKDVLIIIEEGRITKLASIDEKDDFPKLIDLSQHTVLPGLMDCYTHLADPSFDPTKDYYTLHVASYGILGSLYAKKTLQAGFTTVRDVGAGFYADVALRDAINQHWIEGPRMYVSGTAITTTGGHGTWGNWMAPHLRLNSNPGNPVDGPVEVRKRARELIKNGVDLLKINATGGFGTAASVPGAASFTIEEMQTAVEEAHKHGIKVAAHAHGAEGIKNAIKSGVNSIEHATFLDQESIDLMKTKNLFVVMDLLAAYVSLVEMNEDISDKKIEGSNQEVYNAYAANFQKAHEQGVKMAFGTDASIFEHGRNAEQFKLMQDAGMSPQDILKTATLNAAALIGIEENAGSIEVGKWADIIAVKGNPLQNIQLLENVDFVMKEGKVYKSLE